MPKLKRGEQREKVVCVRRGLMGVKTEKFWGGDQTGELRAYGK